MTAGHNVPRDGSPVITQTIYIAKHLTGA